MFGSRRSARRCLSLEKLVCMHTCKCVYNCRMSILLTRHLPLDPWEVPVTVTPEDQISNHKKAKANVRRGRKPKNEKTESKGKPKAAPKSKGSKKNPKVSDTAEPSAPEAAPEPKGRKRKQIEKAQTSRKMTAQSAPEKTFGCSRCRYAALGCKTCRAPGFKPRGHRSKVDAAGADDDE